MLVLSGTLTNCSATHFENDRRSSDISVEGSETKRSFEHLLKQNCGIVVIEFGRSIDKRLEQLPKLYSPKDETDSGITTNSRE